MHRSTSAPKGVRYIATKIQKLTEWKHFFDLQSRTLERDQPKLITHARHGSVTILQSDRSLGKHASLKIARTTIRRITCAQSLGRYMLAEIHHCPQCGIQAGEHESQERHVVWCPNGEMRHFFHARLVGVIKAVLKYAGVPDASVVLEARGLRAADRSRPGDVVALDFLRTADTW